MDGSGAGRPTDHDQRGREFHRFPGGHPRAGTDGKEQEASRKTGGETDQRIRDQNREERKRLCVGIGQPTGPSARGHRRHGRGGQVAGHPVGAEAERPRHLGLRHVRRFLFPRQEGGGHRRGGRGYGRRGDHVQIRRIRDRSGPQAGEWGARQPRHVRTRQEQPQNHVHVQHRSGRILGRPKALRHPRQEQRHRGVHGNRGRRRVHRHRTPAQYGAVPRSHRM